MPATVLVGRYTVVTYDPRGIGHSTREDTSTDIAPEQQAEDVHRLLSTLGRGLADIFSSGGAVVGLALVTTHPADVRTRVAHEPPVIELLPDRDQVRAQVQDAYDTYQADGRPGPRRPPRPARRRLPPRSRRLRNPARPVRPGPVPPAHPPSLIRGRLTRWKSTGRTG
jgi:pimeloyl-ACP methyl ester carboxylesterase